MIDGKINRMPKLNTEQKITLHLPNGAVSTLVLPNNFTEIEIRVQRERLVVSSIDFDVDITDSRCEIISQSLTQQETWEEKNLRGIMEAQDNGEYGRNVFGED